MATLNDALAPRRTPLYHLHRADQEGADAWTQRGGYAVPADQDEPSELQAQIARCALADLSPLARAGFRGRDAAQYLVSREFRLPEAPNRAVHQADGSLAVRLSATEYLLLGGLADDGERIAREEASWRMDERACYLLPRQDTHAWLALTGRHAGEVMAKLCAVDLSGKAFPDGRVAQTSVARVNAIVVNAGHGDLPCFHLLVDSALACYFWPALLDAMQEFGGRAVGMSALQACR